MRIIFIFSSVLFLTFGCNKNSNLEIKNDLQDSLIGEWIPIVEIDSNEIYIDIFPEVGYSFSKDSIEFYNGLFDIENNAKGIRKVKYLGNFKKYKIEANQLYTENLETKKWQKFWEISKIKNDTLFLVNKDKSSNKLKRLKYKKKNQEKIEDDFNKIIFSSSPCYGKCPFLNVSLDRDGFVYFQGQAFTNLIGLHTGKLDQKNTKYIFKKFEKANILTLESEYIANHTDDQTITTTFIKNDKIVKTIYDYGRKSPNELIWAYVPIGNISSFAKLTRCKSHQDFLDINFWSFAKEKKKLTLNASEGFFLWTELINSTITEDNFTPKFEVNYDFNDYTEMKIIKKRIKKVTSDGRYFKFELINNIITYDLGYNFIERNYKSTDFKEIEEYELPNS